MQRSNVRCVHVQHTCTLHTRPEAGPTGKRRYLTKADQTLRTTRSGMPRPARRSSSCRHAHGTRWRDSKGTKPRSAPPRMADASRLPSHTGHTDALAARAHCRVLLGWNTQYGIHAGSTPFKRTRKFLHRNMRCFGHCRLLFGGKTFLFFIVHRAGRAVPSYTVDRINPRVRV